MATDRPHETDHLHPTARRLRDLVEPIAAAVYFAPEAQSRYEALGLNYFEGYFCSRSAGLGAAPWRVLATVDLHIAWRPLLAATGFAFAVSLGEFGATSFLARPDRPTLPVVIYQLVSRPGADSFGMALAASVVLGTVTVAVMAVVERLRVGSMGGF